MFLSSMKSISIDLEPGSDGLYECEIETEFGIARNMFNLRKPSEYLSTHSIYFKFIDTNLKLNGRVEIICQSGNNFVKKIKFKPFKICFNNFSRCTSK